MVTSRPRAAQSGKPAGGVAFVQPPVTRHNNASTRDGRHFTQLRGTVVAVRSLRDDSFGQPTKESR